jgi:ATP-dependent DNA helicase DinG
MTKTAAAPRKKSRASLAELLAAAVGAVPGGTSRPGQEEMAAAVEAAALTGEHLIVQAGTGTGKSLAYLVPALHTGGTVVVSTATLALQAQLVDSDLPRLADAVEPVLRRRPKFALLKGRHHYLCRAKLDGSTAEDPTDGLFDDGPGQWLGAAGKLGKQMTRLREWAGETETGDRTELEPGVDDQTWRLASMPARECIGALKCPFGDECFAEASRARAREADIVVTNHSLLAVDMLAGRHILPDHDLLVIDEAHELVDRVTSAAQAELTPELVNRAARRAKSLVDSGVLDQLEGAGGAFGIAMETAPVGRLISLPDQLRDALIVLDGAVRRSVEGIGEITADDAESVPKTQTKSMLQAIGKTAQRLLEQATEDVAWIAEDERLRRSVVVAPLSVAPQLGAMLFTDRTVVATSATLALGGRFDLVARSFGLLVEDGRTPATNDQRPEPPAVEEPPGVSAASAADAARAAVIAARDAADRLIEEDGEPNPLWRAMDVGSPFDYPKQGILYVASRLPRPGASGLSDAAQQELIELAEAAGGRTLGLFSSRRAATQAAEALRARTDLPVLVQGEDTIGHLVRKFRADDRACLLGVMSLWQGVDVPGPACQLVVVDRLPFPRPDEPLSAARSRAVDDSGGSGFMAISVPHAAVRLAQGAGRLIRAAGDRGVVAVLDSRLHTARYGDFIRKTLPPFWYTTSGEVVRAALRRLDAEPASK